MELIPTILEFVCKEKQFEILLTLDWGNSAILNASPADLNEIKSKSGEYNSFLELQTDVKWMLHNWVAAFPTKKKVQTSIIKLIQFIIDEVHSVKTCRQCYANAYAYPDDSFVLPCDPPHVVVWAKYKDHCYWPSKVMNTTDKIVHVRFFADHYTGIC